MLFLRDFLPGFSGFLSFVFLDVGQLNFEVFKVFLSGVERFFGFIESIVLFKEFIVKVFEDIKFVFEDTGGLLAEESLRITLGEEMCYGFGAEDDGGSILLSGGSVRRGWLGVGCVDGEGRFGFGLWLWLVLGDLFGLVGHLSG